MKCKAITEISMSNNDESRRFLFEELGIRGQWVKLSTSWQTAKQNQHCAENARLLLGQALSAVVLLSSTIKFNGTLILQAQGNGPVNMLVAQATNEGKIRGLVKSAGNVETNALPEMLGDGRLILTITSEKNQPYQGIVALLGDNLAAALENYFAQSEQLNTRLWLFANATTAVGLLLQELPTQDKNTIGWERIEMLANTVTEQEMLKLECEELLYRLFNQEKVRLFNGDTIAFECSCSRAKIEKTLNLLGNAELESILAEREQIEVNCEFCNQYYRFDRIDVEQLLRSQPPLPAGSHSQH